MTGKELRDARAALDLTQALLAEKLGVTVTTVARWERGERRISEPIARLVQFLVDTTSKAPKARPKRRRDRS